LLAPGGGVGGGGAKYAGGGDIEDDRRPSGEAGDVMDAYCVGKVAGLYDGEGAGEAWRKTWGL
jgi:hypothetical protein